MSLYDSNVSLYCSRESLYDAIVNLNIAMVTHHSDLMSLSGVMVSHVEAGQSHLYQYLRWRWFHGSYHSSPARKAAIILQECVRFSGKIKTASCTIMFHCVSNERFEIITRALKINMYFCNKKIDSIKKYIHESRRCSSFVGCSL